MNSEISSIPAKGRHRRLRVLLLVVLPLCALLVGGAFYLGGGRYVETDNAYVKADKVPLSAQVQGPVARVLVRDNQQVKAGDTLFELDTEAFRVAVAKAEAEMAKVRTDLVALQTSYRAQQAQIAVAHTRHEFALKEEKRQADLVARHFTTDASYDNARQQAQQSAQEQLALEEDLKRIEASLSGDVALPVEKQPAYREAAAVLAKARLDLARTTIVAPADGIVSQVPHVGQYVPAGAIAMVLVETAHPWVEANFTETDLTHVRPGQKVKVRIDTYPDVRWEGVVESLSPATGSEFSVIPAQNATGNWVKIVQRLAVRIRLDDEGNLPPLSAGLSALAEVDTDYHRSLFGMTF